MKKNWSFGQAADALKGKMDLRQELANLEVSQAPLIAEMLRQGKINSPEQYLEKFTKLTFSDSQLAELKARLEDGEDILTIFDRGDLRWDEMRNLLLGKYFAVPEDSKIEAYTPLMLNVSNVREELQRRGYLNGGKLDGRYVNKKGLLDWQADDLEVLLIDSISMSCNIVDYLRPGISISFVPNEDISKESTEILELRNKDRKKYYNYYLVGPWLNHVSGAKSYLWPENDLLRWTQLVQPVLATWEDENEGQARALSDVWQQDVNLPDRGQGTLYPQVFCQGPNFYSGACDEETGFSLWHNPIEARPYYLHTVHPNNLDSDRMFLKTLPYPREVIARSNTLPKSAEE